MSKVYRNQRSLVSVDHSIQVIGVAPQKLSRVRDLLCRTIRHKTRHSVDSSISARNPVLSQSSQSGKVDEGQEKAVVMLATLWRDASSWR